jgi:hypothetical protein
MSHWDALRRFQSQAHVSSTSEPSMTQSRTDQKIIDMPFGKRPFRVHIDPTHDGAEVSLAVIDRMRTEMLRRVGLDELLVPVKIASEQRTN